MTIPFKGENRCPVCGGRDEDPRGQGERCYGFLSSDGRYAHCTREDHAAGLPQENGGTFAHRLEGPCKCGKTHGSNATADAGRYSPPSRMMKVKPTVTRYEVRDLEGRLIGIHERTNRADGSKSFRWLHPDERPSKGGEIRPASLPLFGSETLSAAPGDATPILCEGAGKADALRSLGFVALGTCTGASSTPCLDALRPLARFPVVSLWPDNDEPGCAHMARIGKALAGLGVEVRLITWPDAPPKGDAADFIAAGGKREDVQRLLNAATSTRPEAEKASAGAAASLGRRPSAIVRPFADIAAVPVEWLWDLRIPVGMPSLLIGDGGQGKGTSLCDIAARLSRGDGMPDGTGGGAPRSTLWVTAEDDPARVLRPRLDAANADVARVKLLTMRGSEGEERELVLSPEDINALERAIVEHKAALVILDPIAANVPAKVDSHRDEDLRRVLSPLAKTAGRTGAAIVGVKHVGKDTTRGAMQRILGSAAWGNAARSVLAVGVHPNDESEERRVLAHVKSNLGQLAASLAFRLVGIAGTSVARVEWLGTCEVSARDLLGAPLAPEERSALAVATDLLRELLPPGVEVPSKTVEAEAKKRSISHSTLVRARKALSVESRQPGGLGTPWVLWLPAPDTLADGTLAGNGSGGTAAADSVQNANANRGTMGGKGRRDPVAGTPCQSANHQSAKGDGDYPTGWTCGEVVPCEGCGRGAASRDPRGVPLHPWCAAASVPSAG